MLSLPMQFTVAPYQGKKRGSSFRLSFSYLVFRVGALYSISIYSISIFSPNKASNLNCSVFWCSCLVCVGVTWQQVKDLKLSMILCSQRTSIIKIPFLFCFSPQATDDVVKVEVWDVVDKGEWHTFKEPDFLTPLFLLLEITFVCFFMTCQWI